MLKHWIWLSERPNLGARGIYQLLQEFGTAENIYAAQKSDFSRIDGIRKAAVAGLMEKTLTDAQNVIDECARQDISILTINDERYPQRLLNLPDPPCVLYYKGTIPKIDEEPVIAVVGSRRGTNYGLMCAKQFGVQLSNCGCTVVSGGARGIDTMALRGAMNTGAPVICVLGCGVDIVYPPENAKLFQEIAQNGWLVSEYAPGMLPLSRNFPPRNRIISGLSVGTVIVEAASRSGALITADLALEQGRDVFAVPGNIDMSNSIGTNRLIKDGAIVARTGWDVACEYQLRFPEKIHEFKTNAPLNIRQPEKPKDPSKPEPLPKEASRNPKNCIDVYEILDCLSEDEKIVIMLLKDRPMHVDEIVSKCDLRTTQTLVALTMLEVNHYVKRLPGRIFSLAEKS